MNARRWCVAGSLIGVLISLAFTLAMPTRYVRTVALPAPHGHRVPVYGALQPYGPRSLSIVRIEESPRVFRDALLGLIAGGLVALAIMTIRPDMPRRRT